MLIRRMPHPQMPDSGAQPPAHTRRRFLIAAGAGVTATAAGVWLASSLVADDATVPGGAGSATLSVDPDNPRGLPHYDPVYDRAVRGLEAPLGFADCADPTVRATRDTAGSDRHEADLPLKLT